MRSTLVLFLTLVGILAAAGCTKQPDPPPALPALKEPLSVPAEPRPAVVDDVELVLSSTDGEPIEEIDMSTLFRAVVRFRLVEPPTNNMPQADVQLIIYSKQKALTCWQTTGALISEGDNRYRYEAELKSSPYGSREHFVRVRLVDDKKFFIEKPLMVR